MKSKNLLIIISLVIVLIILVAIISIIIANKIKNQNEIIEVYDLIEQNNIQNTEKADIKLQDGTIGIIKIDKIGFEGLIHEGTDLDVLDNYVGHFNNSSIFDGNVALAAHNNSRFWKNLNKVTNGDKIIYTCLLGTRTYEVFNIEIISSDNWYLLQNSDKNIITLITCVHGKPSQRLCVQGIEV